MRPPGCCVRREGDWVPPQQPLREEAAPRLAPAGSDRPAGRPRQLPPGTATAHAANVEGGIRRLLQPRSRQPHRRGLGPPRDHIIASVAGVAGFTRPRLCDPRLLALLGETLRKSQQREREQPRAKRPAMRGNRQVPSHKRAVIIASVAGVAGFYPATTL